MTSSDRFLFTALVAIAVGCTESTAPTSETPTIPSAPSTPSAPTTPTVPTAPTTPTTPTAPATPVALPPFPELTRAGTVYRSADDELYSRPFGYPIESRYVLYDDATFALQFVSQRWGFGEYKGSFTRVGDAIAFDWDASSAAAPWDATGTVDGDVLSVSYNMNMQMSDFIDGSYLRVATSP